MAGAWSDLVEQGTNDSVDSSRWLLEHLLAAEGTDRAMRSVSHQMHSAKFPVHRDLAGFDFEASPVDRKLVHQLADLSFTEAAHNAVLVGGPGTGKTHLATAIGVSGITRHGMRVRFYSTVDLVNALPDGHLKFLHPWPGQTPPGQDRGILVFSSKRLFGKRSASGRRRAPGSGGQATHPAGAVHRLVLWAGGLSTAGGECQSAGALMARRWAASFSR